MRREERRVDILKYSPVSLFAVKGHVEFVGGAANSIHFANKVSRLDVSDPKTIW